MKTFSLLEIGAEIVANDAALKRMEKHILEAAAKMIAKRAKAAIGKGYPDWPPLAESTIADKKEHGFATPKPLLRTGELKDSIEVTVGDHEAAVGSNDPVALYQELGTSHIPPRSFLVESAHASEEKIVKMVAGAAIAALTGHGRNVGSAAELLHAAREVGHELKEQWEDLLEEGEND